MKALNRKVRKMLTINPVQNNSSLSKSKNSPAFKGELICNENTFRFIEKSLADVYSNSEPFLKANLFDEGPFDAAKIIEALKNAFRKITAPDGTYKLDGTIELQPSNSRFYNNDGMLNLTYTDASGKTYKSESPKLYDENNRLIEEWEGRFPARQLLQNKQFEMYAKDGPFSSVVGFILDYVDRAKARGVTN